MSFHTKLEHTLAQGDLSARQHKDLIKLIKTTGLPYNSLLLEAGMSYYLSGTMEDDNGSIHCFIRIPNTGGHARSCSEDTQLELVLRRLDFNRPSKLSCTKFSGRRENFCFTIVVIR